ncbi:MAG: aspartate/glutamate racemase family protein [Candidatus Bipolaricaulia bacterium]
MKKIGILGGISPESSLEYYRLFIDLAKEREPTGKYPELIIYSLNFEDFCRPVTEGKDEQAVTLLRDKLVALEKAGADFAMMASNTPHKYYQRLTDQISIPLLSIVESTAEAASENGFSKVGLLGTEVTMSGDFYSEVFSNKGIKVVTPEENEQEYIHERIMNELVNGEIVDSTRKRLVEITREMRRKKGVEAIILGCTELPLILSEEETGFPVLDTEKIHVNKAYSIAAD